MAAKTGHFGLQKLNVGDSIAGAGNGYSFSWSDRDLVDNLLYQGAVSHRHNGATPAISDPSSAPTLSLDQATGSLPPGTRVYYVFTLLDPNGFESAISPQNFYDIPSGLTTPSAPTAATATTGGTLAAGGYWYILSAYTSVNSQETLPSVAVYIPVPSGTTTNTITLTFPTQPTGASGWNIYRRGPAETNYAYLTSVSGTPATFVDNGSFTENLNRTIPTKNTTHATNSITVTYPGATPVVPAGYSWKIYRSFATNVYTNCLLTTIANQATFFKDTGGALLQGAPPVQTEFHGSPSKVDLTAEVTGVLPVANGGTGGGNFVDLTSAQTVTGLKTFDGIKVQTSGGTLILNIDPTTGALTVTGVVADFPAGLTVDSIASHTAGGPVTSSSPFHVQRVNETALASPTSNYACSATDRTVLANSTSGQLVVTLPTTASVGRRITVIKTDSSSNAVLISTGQSTLDGIWLQNASREAYYDGSAWHIVTDYMPGSTGVLVGDQIGLTLLAVPIAQVGTWALNQSSGLFNGGSQYNSSLAQNDSATFGLSLPSGVYNLDFFYGQDNTSAIITVQVDGATVGTVDGFASGATPPTFTAARASLKGLQIASNGHHTFTFLAATKNASSSGYRMDLSEMVLTRTTANVSGDSAVGTDATLSLAAPLTAGDLAAATDRNAGNTVLGGNSGSKDTAVGTEVGSHVP